MKNFKKLNVWQKGIELVKTSYLLSSKLPKEEKYGIISQINRASVSIPSNIAEGSSRRSEKEYIHYLEIALGSAFEVETLLIVITETNLTSENKLTEKLMSLTIETQKMLMGLISSITK